MWTDSPDNTTGKLYCYDVIKNEIRHQSIGDVAVQNYSYDISTLNEADKKLVIDYFQRWLDKKITLTKCFVKLKKTNEIFKKDYIETNFISFVEEQGLKMLKKLYDLQFPFEGRSELEKVEKEMSFVLLQSLFGYTDIKRIENLCARSLELRRNPSEDLRFKFYEFLCVQMFRTWRSKDNTFKAVSDTKKNFPETKFKDTTKAIFPLMMIVNAEMLANNLCEKDFYIELIENESGKNFLTGDFPVINLSADYKKEEESKELIIYYPLSPLLAIKCTNSIKHNKIVKIKDDNIVDRYNKKIVEAATKQIYAKNKDDLSFLFEFITR